MPSMSPCTAHQHYSLRSVLNSGTSGAGLMELAQRKWRLWVGMYCSDLIVCSRQDLENGDLPFCLSFLLHKGTQSNPVLRGCLRGHHDHLVGPVSKTAVLFSSFQVFLRAFLLPWCYLGVAKTYYLCTLFWLFGEMNDRSTSVHTGTEWGTANPLFLNELSQNKKSMLLTWSGFMGEMAWVSLFFSFLFPWKAPGLLAEHIQSMQIYFTFINCFAFLWNWKIPCYFSS